MVHALALISVTHPESLSLYREKASAALAQHGGAVVQASGTLSVLDGTPQMPTMAAVLSFPDADAAKAWANDPSLAETHGLRRAAGVSEIILLE